MPLLCRSCFFVDSATHTRSSGQRCPACGSPRILAHLELFDLHLAHLDCDAFYASVEKRDRPELRDLPVIIGGGHRGVVSTCCYIARQSGVRSAMPMGQALRLCPDAVVLPPSFRKYQAESQKIFDRVRALTPQVQTLALDEAWLDLTGTERLNGGPPILQLARLQSEIETQLGLGISIGLAPNKFLAKMASEQDKPRGLFVIGNQDALEFLHPKPVIALPGIGPAQAKTLRGLGYETVGDLAKEDPKRLITALGEPGYRLYRLALGQDSRPVANRAEQKIKSCETTFDHDLCDHQALEAELWPLCEKLAKHLRHEQLLGHVVILKLRRADFQILTRRLSLSEPTQTARTLFETASHLLAPLLNGTFYRLIGVGLGGLMDEEARSKGLFSPLDARAQTTERTMDKIEDRFGKGTIVSGRSLRLATKKASVPKTPSRKETPSPGQANKLGT